LGTLWNAGLDGVWRAGGNPMVATTTGYVAGRFIWRHNGTSWVQVWVRDTTPPSTPVVTLAIVSGTKNKVNVTVTNGAVGPIKRTVVKANWTGTWPSNPGTIDADYRSQTGATGEPWSEYFTNLANATSQATTKTLPASFQTFTIPLSTVVRVSAWAQDDFFNWSTAGTASITTLAADPPAPVLKTVSASSNCVDAGQWSTTNNFWTDSGNSTGYGAQGGGYGLEGFWFYNGWIKNTLAKMVTGVEARVFVYRVNSNHGINGGGLIHYGVHSAATKPAGRPAATTLYSTTTLLRGQGAWCQLPDAWIPLMKSGGTAGLYIGGVGVTSYSSNLYNLCYGRGTTGGQWYMKWQQY
jgi:hypothetical protein